MTPEVEARRNKWSPAVLAKMEELAELVSREKFGQGGPPLGTTWAQIEEIGHQVGQLAATEVDQKLQRQNAEQIDHVHPCPDCGAEAQPSVKHRALQTRLGPADVAEPACYCDACRRHFFPTADPA